MKHCCWYVCLFVCLFPHAFWVSLFKQGPASQIDAAGSTCRGQLFAPSSQILRTDGPFLVLRIGATAGSPSPIHLMRHWGKWSFLLRCQLAAFVEWEPSASPLFFCNSRGHCLWGRMCRLHAPAGTGPHQESLGWGAELAESTGRQPESRQQRRSTLHSRWPSSDVCSSSSSLESSLTKVSGCACYKKNLQKGNLHMGL